MLKTMKDFCPDILGISEMRRTGQGHIVVMRSTVLYSGKQDNHMHGVRLILCNHATQELVGWRLVSKRIVMARLCTRHVKATIVKLATPSSNIN